MQNNSKYLIKFFFPIIIFLISHLAFGSLPVTMDGPTPAIPAEIASGSTSTHVYVVHNRVPTQDIPLTVLGISAPVSRVAVPGNCGSSVPRGGSCNIGIQIAPQTVDVGKTINQTLIVRTSGRQHQDLTSPIQFKVTSGSAVLTSISIEPMTATIPAGLLIPLKATGHYSNGSTQDITKQVTWVSSDPNILTVDNDGLVTAVVVGTAHITASLGAITQQTGQFDVLSSLVMAALGTSNENPGDTLAMVTDSNGKAWAQWSFSNPSGTPIGFEAMDCSGSGSYAFCAAVGNEDAGTPPRVVISRDAGQSWSFVDTSGISAHLLSVSCTGQENASNLCAAVGRGNGGEAYIYVSNDGNGNVWSSKSYSGNQKKRAVDATFDSVSCLGDSKTEGRCVAVGFISNIVPLIAVSTNKGESWLTKIVPGLAQGSLSSVSCTGTGSSNASICVATGSDILNRKPIVLVSHNGGDDWQISDIKGLGLDPNVELTKVSCSGKSDEPTCAIIGSAGRGEPVVIVADNAGLNLLWSKAILTALPEGGGNFASVSCAKGVCAAAGLSANRDVPSLLFLAASNPNDLKNWTFKSVNEVTSADLSSVECVNAGSAQSICAAVGSDGGNPSKPEIIYSLDAGLTWNIPKSSLPENGNLEVLGATEQQSAP